MSVAETPPAFNRAATRANSPSNRLTVPLHELDHLGVDEQLTTSSLYSLTMA
jgi:hypothetical protein